MIDDNLFAEKVLFIYHLSFKIFTALNGTRFLILFPTSAITVAGIVLYGTANILRVQHL